MTPVDYALVARLHGVCAGLGLALLLHPVLNLGGPRARSPWTRRTAELGALLLVAPFAAGWWIYPTYRAQVKPGLLASDPGIALRFETKEHLAALAVALAVGGAVALRVGGGGPNARRAARTALASAWVLGVIAALHGVWVAAHAHPGW